MDAALTLRLTTLKLESCEIGRASAFALPRLLNGDSLQELVLDGEEFGFMGVNVAMQLANALRNNHTLMSLSLLVVGLWHDNGVSGAMLVDALVGHPSLSHLTFMDAAYGECGALFGALVANNSTQLHASRIGLCAW